MPTLDTSDFLNNAQLWTHTSSALEAYATNTVNAYTVKETDTRTYASNRPQWWCNTPHVNYIGDQGHGKSQRPGQTFSFAEGVQHTHFIIDVGRVQIYTNEVIEGNEASYVPTGVIGILLYNYKITGDINNPFDNPNNAAPEIDLYIYDASDTSKWMSISNFPLPTLNIPTTDFGYSPQIYSWISRGGLGTAHFYRGAITHNISTSQQTWNNWTIQEMAADSGRLGLAYRIHDILQPFTLTHSVPALNAASAINEEEDEPEPVILSGSATGTIRLSGIAGGQLEEPEGEMIAASAEDNLELRGHAVHNITQHHLSVTASGRIRLSPGDLVARVDITGRAVGDIRFLDEVQSLVGDELSNVVQGPIGIHGSARAILNGVSIRDYESDEDDDEGGFIVVAGRRLWRMLGLR